MVYILVFVFMNGTVVVKPPKGPTMNAVAVFEEETNCNFAASAILDVQPDKSKGWINAYCFPKENK